MRSEAKKHCLASTWLTGCYHAPSLFAQANPQLLMELFNAAVERSAPLLPELAPGAASTWLRFQALLLRRAGQRLESPEMMEHLAAQLEAASLPRFEVVDTEQSKRTSTTPRQR